MPNSTMRSRFKGHFKVNKEEAEEIWKNAVFVFDANIPLNLYRYSKETSDDFLQFLNDHKGRIWMPDQAVREFLENRAPTIIEQIKTYGKTQNEIGDICKSFSGSRGHPHISAKAEKKLNEVVKIIEDELSTGLQKQEALIHDDPIKETLANIFGESIGDCYTTDRLKELFEEGKIRYQSKTPPGFKDEGKVTKPETDIDYLRIFGDWILWRQTMDFAKTKNVSVIFVTDDRKEDWWERKNGKTIGPRPELISEFSQETSQQILIYNFERFLKLTSTHLTSHVNSKSIEEVEAQNEIKNAKQTASSAFRDAFYRLANEAAMKRELGSSDFDVMPYLSDETETDVESKISNLRYKLGELQLEVSELNAQRKHCEKENDLGGMRKIDDRLEALWKKIENLRYAEAIYVRRRKIRRDLDL